MEAYIHRYNPDVAYDPINNRYLMVYEKCKIEYYPEVWGRFISAGGVLSPEFPISEDRRCYEPKVVYNPENETFLVVWSDDRYYEGGLIYAQILDKEGNLYGDKGNFAVCPTTGPDSGQDRPAVAVTSNGNYLIAWEECVSDDDLYLEIYGQLLDQEGEPVGEKLTLVSKKWDQSDPVLAYSGGKYFMAFVDKNYTYDNTIINILGLYIGADGLPEEEFLTIAFDSDWIVELDVVADNGRIFVVWEDWRDDWTGKIYGRFINADGIMEDEFRVYQSDISQCAPSVTLNTKNGGFLVAWKDYQGRLYAKHFTAEGSGLGEPVQINPEGEEPENVKVAYNSEENNYLAVYEKYGEGPTCIGITILSVPEEESEPPGEFLEIQEQPLAAGATHSLVLMDGQVWFTGYSVDSYALGLSLVEELDGVVAVSANDCYSLALKADGTVWAWGKNSCGQLGNGTDYTDDPVPQRVYGLEEIVAISAGSSHALALKADGTVWAWGDNNKTKLGIGSEELKIHTPQQVKDPDGNSYLSGIVAISAGFDHSLALKDDGTVWAWGDNSWGQLGQGTSSGFEPYPIQVKDSSGAGYLSEVVAIAAGPFHNLALKSDGTVWAWGENGYGQLGDGTTSEKDLPVQVRGEDGTGYLSNIIQIAAGGEEASHSLALRNDGKVWAWGNGIYGQLGNGGTSSYTPVQVSGLGTVVVIAAGGQCGTSLFLENDGTIKACGFNSFGELGDGTEIQRDLVVEMKMTSRPPETEDITIINLVTQPDIWNTDKVKVENVLPNATVKVYTSSWADTPLGIETMPPGSESPYLIIYIEEGFPAEIDSIWVSITEEGKTESERVEVWIPTPLMSKKADFNVDESDQWEGKVTFVVTAEQISAMEVATGKTIAMLRGFVGRNVLSDEDVFNPAYISEDNKVLFYPPASEELESRGTINKNGIDDLGPYYYAIAAYDSSDKVIAYYLSEEEIYVTLG